MGDVAMNESQRKQDNSIQGSKQPAPTYSLACRFQKAPAATKTSMARHHITPREKKRPSLPRTKRSTGAKERSVRVILNNKKKSKKIVKSSCSMFSPRARAINHSNARATNPTGLNKHETRPPHQPPLATVTRNKILPTMPKRKSAMHPDETCHMWRSVPCISEQG